MWLSDPFECYLSTCGIMSVPIHPLNESVYVRRTRLRIVRSSGKERTHWYKGDSIYNSEGPRDLSILTEGYLVIVLKIEPEDKVRIETQWSFEPS